MKEKDKPLFAVNKILKDVNHVITKFDDWIHAHLQPLSYQLCFFSSSTTSDKFSLSAKQDNTPIDYALLKQLQQAGIVPYQSKALLQALTQARAEVKVMQAELNVLKHEIK
eukprot:COSAG01_NODE_21687_length_890_cov_1.039191_1_plen_111_part_00